MIANTSQLGARAAKRHSARAGRHRRQGQGRRPLAYINDPLGDQLCEVSSPLDGIVIGKTNLPLVFAGEAVFNIAAYESPDRVSDHIEAYHEELAPNGTPNGETDVFQGLV